MTPHNTAKPGDFAETVLMPGDPKRAQFIAEHFLEDCVQVNDVRGINGFTGFYKGKRVSVMASGMGAPSMGIYAYELYNFYDVKCIIRVGTAEAINPVLHKKSIVLAESASYMTGFMAQYDFPGTYAPSADFRLLLKAYDKACEMGITCKAGPVISIDFFYNMGENDKKWREMGILAKEMEAAALYATAARAGREALCICTISDVNIEGQEPEICTPEEREQALTDMIRLALELV